jgi:ribonuclease HI
MPEVNIYIDVDFKGQQKCGIGTYSIVLEYIKDGEPITKEYFGGVKSTTKNRTAIKACIVAMSHLKYKCRVNIISNNQFIAQSISEGWYKTWLQYGLNNKKEPAKNIDLWQQLNKYIEMNEVTISFEATNTYSMCMYFELQKAVIEFEEDKNNV